jgi:hypothetical protein
MTDSTNPVETRMDMQPRSLPTRPYTSTRCYLTNSCVGKSVHLLLGQTTYVRLIWLSHPVLPLLLSVRTILRLYANTWTVLWYPLQPCYLCCSIDFYLLFCCIYHCFYAICFYSVNIFGIPNMCTVTQYTYANVVQYWPDDDFIKSKLASLHIDNKWMCFDWS